MISIVEAIRKALWEYRRRKKQSTMQINNRPGVLLDWVLVLALLLIVHDLWVNHTKLKSLICKRENRNSTHHEDL